MLNPKKSPILFSLLFGFGNLLFVSLLPIWRVAVRGWSGGDPFTQGVIWRDAADWYHFVSSPPGLMQGLLIRELITNLRTAALAFAAGIVIGRLLYWRLWQRSIPGNARTEGPRNEQ